MITALRLFPSVFFCVNIDRVTVYWIMFVRSAQWPIKLINANPAAISP